MLKKTWVFLLILLTLSCFPIQGNTEGVWKSSTNKGYPLPALPRKMIEQKFQIAKQEFLKRWQVFSKGKKWKPFPKQFTDEQILTEFETVINTRDAVYYENPGQQPLFSNPDFERSQELLTGGFYKAPHLIAFAYNCSHPSYNSSNVTLNGHKFLALEGPQKPHHTDHFKRLLINYNVKHLIRLTNDVDKGVFKSENYWKDSVIQGENGQQMLSFMLPEEEQRKPYYFPYYAIDHWPDNSGTDHDGLLDFVQNVRKNYKPGELLAVHCSAGVGRTGTFIAAFLLLDEIDRQLKNGTPIDKLKISIEEIVYKISLQRAYLVGEKAQYLTLHKLVQEYLVRVKKIH